MKDAGKKDPGREEMIRELVDLAGSIDEEGLLFLVDQANVLLYNQRVEKLNTQRKKLKTRADVTDTREPSADIEVIEKEGGKHFYIVIGGFRICFTREEMRALVKICHAAEGERAEGTRRLYTWLSRNRSDLLHDGQVGSGADPRLATLWDHLVSTYPRARIAAPRTLRYWRRVGIMDQPRVAIPVHQGVSIDRSVRTHTQSRRS